MSIIANNIFSPNILSLENTVMQQSSQIENLINIYSSENKRKFDQVTKQKVDISYDEIKKRYRFEIQKPENSIYVYQVWKKNNEKMNSDRIYYYEKLRNWIESFKISLEKYNFTPTTLIEIDNIFYPTVLVDAGIEIRNDQDYCVFYFENKSIKTIIDDMPKSGLRDNVRFDIDSDESYIVGYNYDLVGSPWFPSNIYGMYSHYSDVYENSNALSKAFFLIYPNAIYFRPYINTGGWSIIDAHQNGSDTVIVVKHYLDYPYITDNFIQYYYKLVTAQSLGSLMASDNKIYQYGLNYNSIIETFIKTSIYGTWTENKNGIIYTLVINNNNNVSLEILGTISYGTYYPIQSKIVWTSNGIVTSEWFLDLIGNPNTITFIRASDGLNFTYTRTS